MPSSASPPFTLPSFAVGTGGLSGNPEDLSLPTGLVAQAKVLREALAQFRVHRLSPWIDTALHYGAGNALRAIGIALGEHPDPRITLSIKVGRVLEKPTAEKPYEPSSFSGEPPLNRRFDYSRKGTLDAFEQSFEFLNKDRIAYGWQPIRPEDLNTVVFVHDPESGAHGERTDQIVAQVKNEALPALAELKAQGKIKAIGVGTNEVAAARALIDDPNLDIAMMAGRFTLLANGASNAPAQIQQDTKGLAELLQAAREQGKQIVTAAPGNSGILYGGKWYNYTPATPEVAAFKDAVKAVFDRHNVPLAAGALQFPMLAGASAVVCGPCSAREAEESMVNFTRSIPQQLWTDLAAQNLINPGLLGTIQETSAVRQKSAQSV